MASDPFFAQGCPRSGLLKKGNIDIYHRAVAHLPGGKIATVESFSVGVTYKKRRAEVLIPGVVNGRVVSAQAAMRHFFSSGENLGIFDNARHATAYAICLHKQQERFYRGQ